MVAQQEVIPKELVAAANNVCIPPYLFLSFMTYQLLNTSFHPRTICIHLITKREYQVIISKNRAREFLDVIRQLCQYCMERNVKVDRDFAESLYLCILFMLYFYPSHYFKFTLKLIYMFGIARDFDYDEAQSDGDVYSFENQLCRPLYI